MELSEARRMAESLIEEHLPNRGVRFTFTKARHEFGYWMPYRKTLGLSAPLTEINDEAEVRDTLLHEIAHVLAGYNAHHGPAWQAEARRIGARPERTFKEGTAKVLPRLWVGTCPNGHTTGRDRMTAKAKRIACGICCKELNDNEFSAEYLFEWSRNELAMAA